MKSRYVTWRYADRHFSKVHVVDSRGVPLCGRTPGREIGRPIPPIPDSALCEGCASATVVTGNPLSN